MSVRSFLSWALWCLVAAIHVRRLRKASQAIDNIDAAMLVAKSDREHLLGVIVRSSRAVMAALDKAREVRQ